MSFRRKASEILGHPASSLFLDPAGSRVVKL